MGRSVYRHMVKEKKRKRNKKGSALRKTKEIVDGGKGLQGPRVVTMEGKGADDDRETDIRPVYMGRVGFPTL